jgi:hypothetical protein
MIKLAGPYNTGAAAGENGSATANSTSKLLSGRVLAVYIKYNDSPPAGTCDVTIATLGTAPAAPSLAILTLTNAATSGWFYPRHGVHGSTGTALLYAENGQIVAEAVPIHDQVKFTIAGANAADNADVWLLLEQ